MLEKIVTNSKAVQKNEGRPKGVKVRGEKGDFPKTGEKAKTP